MEKEIHEWQEIKELDAEIRTIEPPKEKGDFWVIDIGLFESLGEQYGEILTKFFDSRPTLTEIKEEVKEYLIEMKSTLENILTYRQEKQLELIKKLNLSQRR